MQIIEPYAPHTGGANPRHPHQEIADILAAGILRLRVASSVTTNQKESRETVAFGLGFTAHQRVNANPYQEEGVRT